MMGTMDVMPVSTSEVEVMAKFRQDKLRREKLYFSSAYVGKNFIRLAVRERQSRNQHVGVQNNPHARGGLPAGFMDETIHVLFTSYPQGLGPTGGLALEFLPPAFFEIHAQGLTDQLALGPVFFPRSTLSLASELGR